jgi:hypothetical protein
MQNGEMSSKGFIFDMICLIVATICGMERVVKEKNWTVQVEL